MSIYAKTRPNPHVDLTGEYKPKSGDVRIANDGLNTADITKADTKRVTVPAASLAPRGLSEHLSWLEDQFGYSQQAQDYKLANLVPFDRKRPNTIYFHDGTEYHSAEASALRAINDARRGLIRPVGKSGAPPGNRMVEPSGWREYGMPNGLVPAQNKQRWVGLDRRPTTADDLQRVKQDAGPGFLPRVFNYFQ